MPVEMIGWIAPRVSSEVQAAQGPAFDADVIAATASIHEQADFDRALIGYFSDAPDGFLIGAHAATATQRLGLLLAHRPGFISPTLAARKIDAAGILPRPVQQPIPIWMGGGATPAVLDRIGRLADGWIANAGLSANLDERVLAIRAAAERAGRDPDAIGIQGVAVLLRGDDGDDVDGFRRQVDAARERNLSHLAVLTMNQGRSPEQHIDAVRTTAEAIELNY
jgi:alkanesulfonate monooxygenase SsuD/methylene tetrahydromethanopterin reductase-like flavin-dependent oxidoreductase (luciferase family)